LYYDGTWHHVDLTGGVQNAALNSSITATMDPVANTEDVEYIGSNHVYEVWYNGTWHTADLTTASGAAPNADSSSGMNTLMNTIGNGMEVEYIGTDHHVYALWYLVGGGGIWHFTDLTSTTGNPVAAAGSPLTSTMDSIANTEDLEYIGSDHHVYELWYNGLWHPADITSLVNAGANADITGGIHTLNNTIANAMEVHYIGTDQHVYSFWYPSGGGGVWHISDLTSLTPAASSIAGSPLASAADSVAGTIDLTYVGADQHVHVLSYNGSWHETVLTAP
jgi:hypothetical protein